MDRKDIHTLKEAEKMTGISYSRLVRMARKRIIGAPFGDTYVLFAQDIEFLEILAAKEAQDGN